MLKTDSQLQEEIMQELKWDVSVTHEHVGVVVEDSIVTLTGTVPSFVEKAAAERAAQRVAGVKAVVEQIEVKLPGSFKRNDHEIAKAIVEQFKWNVQVPDDTVKARIEEGWVELVGDVEWGYQRTAAENSIRSLAGIKGIINNILIKSKNIETSTVKQKIEDALKREAEREAKRISVEVKGSHVILSGAVRSFAEMEDAKWAAWSAPGVTKVENKMYVANIQ